MAVDSRLNWSKWLYIGGTEGDDEQSYHFVKRRRHMLGEHTSGVVWGCRVLATSPTPDMEVHVQVGRVIDPNGEDVNVEAIEDVDLTAYAVAGALVYIVAEFDEVLTDAYVVPETGVTQYKYYEEVPPISAQTAAPGASQVELARVVVSLGATQIFDAGDNGSFGGTPLVPVWDEIDHTHRTYSYVRSTWMDDQKARFGSNQEASAYYDGSDLILDPSELGTGRVLIGATGTKELVAYIQYHPYHIHGLQCSTPVFGADEYANVVSGGARDSTDTDNMDLVTGVVKGIDAAWTVGTLVGGLDTGTVAANTLYAIWLIKRSDTGVVDALLSLSFTAPTMPANYDLKRLIGAVRTDATSDLVPFKQVGDHFTYLWNDTPVADIADASITSLAWVTAAILCPPDCLAHVRGMLSNATSSDPQDGNLFVSAVPPAAWTGSSSALSAVEATGFVRLAGMVDVLTNNASQIRYAAAEISGAASVEFYTVSFEMLTRRDAP